MGFRVQALFEALDLSRYRTVLDPRGQATGNSLLLQGHRAGLLPIYQVLGSQTPHPFESMIAGSAIFTMKCFPCVPALV